MSSGIFFLFKKLSPKNFFTFTGWCINLGKQMIGNHKVGKLFAEKLCRCSNSESDSIRQFVLQTVWNPVASRKQGQVGYRRRNVSAKHCLPFDYPSLGCFK
jgi:hypothetical protein